MIKILNVNEFYTHHFMEKFNGLIHSNPMLFLHSGTIFLSRSNLIYSHCSIKATLETWWKWRKPNNKGNLKNIGKVNLLLLLLENSIHWSIVWYNYYHLNSVSGKFSHPLWFVGDVKKNCEHSCFLLNKWKNN